MRFKEEGAAQKAIDAVKAANDGKVVIKGVEATVRILEGECLRIIMFYASLSVVMYLFFTVQLEFVDALIFLCIIGIAFLITSKCEID